MCDEQEFVWCCAYCGGSAKIMSEPRWDKHLNRISPDDEEIETVVEQRGFVAHVETVYRHKTVAYCMGWGYFGTGCGLLSEKELVKVEQETYVANGYHAPREYLRKRNSGTNAGS